MIRTLLIFSVALTLTGCVNPGKRGPEMVGYKNAAGLKVPAVAVDAHETNGYWNCGNGRDDTYKYEHAVRCVLDDNAPSNF